MADKWQCCDLNPGIFVQVLSSYKRLWFLCFFMNVLCVFWTPNILLAQKAWYMSSSQELSPETPGSSVSFAHCLLPAETKLCATLDRDGTVQSFLNHITI